MKKIVAILLVAILMMTLLVGCGKDRILYKNIKFENYLEVKDYLGIEVDTTTDGFAEYYKKIFDMDIGDYSLYKEVKEGVVENGDIVNLDYEGKLDGVAFQGGTAQGYDLKIGSKTFIDDFEEELIGVAVGETKDVTAKFPENYGNAELNGKEAIFTCKINHIKKVMTEEEAYEKMHFDSADDYKADIKKRAVKQYILDVVINNSKITDYPEKDSDLICEAIYEVQVDMYKEGGQDLEKLIIANNMTVENYKSQIATQMVPEMMKVNMVMYCIFDAEELELLESTLSSQEIDQPAIAESYAVQDTVMEYLYDNAKIK